MVGLQEATKHPTNLSKISQGVQETKELIKGCHTYSPIDPGVEESWRAVNAAFMTQSAPGIRKKLQRLEGFEGENLLKLVEIATRIYNNREDQEDRQARKTGS